MRHEKAKTLIVLAIALASSPNGLTLDEMAVAAGAGRRTAERMRDALRDLFPRMEDIDDPPTKRFKIPGGLSRLLVGPTSEEVAALAAAAELAENAGQRLTAARLHGLSAKLLASPTDSLAHDLSAAGLL